LPTSASSRWHAVFGAPRKQRYTRLGHRRARLIERRGTADKKPRKPNSPPDPKRGLRKRRSSSIDPHPPRSKQLLSWRTGYLIFRDTALADAVPIFNRYSARKIYIEDPAIAGIRIGGKLPLRRRRRVPLAFYTAAFRSTSSNAATALF